MQSLIFFPKIDRVEMKLRVLSFTFSYLVVQYSDLCSVLLAACLEGIRGILLNLG